MFDTLATARTLAGAGINPKHADALAAAIRQATEHADYVTKSELQAALAAMETRLVRWMVVVAGVVVAAQRFL